MGFSSEIVDIHGLLSADGTSFISHCNARKGEEKRETYSFVPVSRDWKMALPLSVKASHAV